MIEIEYDDKDYNCIDTVLSEIYIPYEAHQMSLYSYLFPIWTWGGSEIRRFQGIPFGSLEDSALQSFFKGGL